MKITIPFGGFFDMNKIIVIELQENKISVFEIRNNKFVSIVKNHILDSEKIERIKKHALRIFRRNEDTTSIHIEKREILNLGIKF